MLRLNISTQPVRLEYAIQNARLNLQITRPEVQMKTTPAKLEIRQPRGELSIDQTPCRYSIGLKNNTDFNRDNAALARQNVMDAISRTAEEGDLMARIESKTNAIADIAVDATTSEVPEITWAHIASPEIHYQASPVQFNVTAGKVTFTIKPGTVQGDYQPGGVDIRVAQYASIEMSTIDVKA